MNIPNRLSLSRICMIPLFIVAYFLPFEWGAYVAIGIFALCCFTDFLDGYIARKYKMVTDLGKLLDPIADKILVCAALFCVVATNPLQYFANSLFVMPENFTAMFGMILLTVGSILILARELLISAVRMIAASKGVVVQANIFGKIKTVTQDICLPLMILLNANSQSYSNVSQNALIQAVTEPSIVARMKFFDVIWLVGVTIFAVAVVMTIISGVIYLVQNKKVFEDK